MLKSAQSPRRGWIRGTLIWIRCWIRNDDATRAAASRARFGLHYSYFWHDERRAGRKEGRKDRPSVVVLCAKRARDDAATVTVLPITHTAPTDPASAVEIPPRVKQHLGLDEKRSWIVVSEGNVFVWPGFDLRKVPKTGRYDYGFLPPRLFDRVRHAFVAFYKAGRAKKVPRA